MIRNHTGWYSILGFQFSRQQAIRALVVMAVGGVVFCVAFCAWYIPPRATGRKVKSVGGHVQYQPQQSPNVAALRFAHGQFRMFGLTPTDKFVETVDLWHSNVTDAWLRNLQPLDDLTELCLHERQVGPGLSDLAGLRQLTSLRIWHHCSADLRHLRHLPHLGRVNFFQTDCSDFDLSPLAEIPQLHSLEFPSSSVTEQQLKQISQFKTLQSLGLMYSQLDAAALRGIKHLANLPNLHTLYICDVGAEVMEDIARIESLSYLSIERGQLTNAGFAVLAKLPRLRNLRLQHNALPIDVDALRSAMPLCRIDYTGPAGK